MAVQTVTRTTCDRCPRVIEEVGAKTLENAGAKKALIYLEGEGVEPIKFDDLCDKCVVRVSHLVKQLRLEKEDKDADDKKPDTKDTSAKKTGKDKSKGKDAEASASAPA
jgi:hypothetical protein